MRLVRSILVVIGLQAAVFSATAQELVGRIARQEGDVMVLRQEAPHPASVGSELLVGDRIVTGPTGKMLVECESLTVIVGPDTSLVLRQFAVDRSGGYLDGLFELVTGITRLVGETFAGSRSVRVITETAVASVRSTDWLVDVTETGTGVFTREGAVTVVGRVGGVVVLEDGEGTDVRPGEPPTQPRMWGAARRDAALARTSF